MTAAVDFGSNRIRVLTCDGDAIHSKSFRSRYSVLVDSQDQRQMLGRLNIPYAVCDSHLVVIGDYVDDVRCVNSTPTVPIFADGQIAADDPPARQVLNLLVETMLPQANPEELCAVTVPGSFREGDGSAEFLRNLVSLRGYRVLPVSSGLATVLAGGATDRFSAIGISFGAQCCDLSLVARGNELDREVVRRGGDWMDIELARQNSQFVWDREGHCYLDADSIADWKLASFRSLTRRDSVLEHTLCNLYIELLSEVAGAVETLLKRNPPGPGAIPILCTGGVARIDGFADAFRQALRSSRVDPACLGGIRLIDDPLAVGRGGLIQAALQCEAQSVAA